MRVSALAHLHGPRLTIAEEQAAALLRDKLETTLPQVRALNLRLDEIVDARGELMTVCRVRVTLAGTLRVPPFLVEGRASHFGEAAEEAGEAVENAVHRAVEAISDDHGTTPTIHPRRTPHGHLTRVQARVTSVRERSVTRPSRKSTRKSANRVKHDTMRRTTKRS